MRSDPSKRALELAEVTNPGVLASLARIDAMSDEQLRELVRGEDSMVVEAAEGIIADRGLDERRAS